MQVQWWYDDTYSGMHPAEADTDVVLVGVSVDYDQPAHYLTNLE